MPKQNLRRTSLQFLLGVLSFQTLGFLSTFAPLATPTLVIFFCYAAACVSLGVAEYISLLRVNSHPTTYQVASCFAGSLVLVVAGLLLATVGAWVGGAT